MRTSNKVHRRKEHRKATRKEKEILKEIKVRISGKKTTSSALMIHREQLLDTLQYMKMKLEKMIIKGKRVGNNALFRQDERQFYRSINESRSRMGNVPDINEFFEFWGGIWESEKVTPIRPWVAVVANRLKEKVVDVKELNATEEQLVKIIKKTKNWSSRGIDGIQNYWWKKFKPTQQVLCSAVKRLKKDYNLIPNWYPSERTLMLPKTNLLSNVRDRRPITCLNTSHKIYAGIIGKYMKDHACNNSIWDEGRLGGVEGVLVSVDQLRIDNCIMDEVRK